MTIEMEHFLAAILIFLCALPAAAAKRPFTVDDSIELSSFAGGVIDAPDHKHFLAVTERGVVATNRTESTLWLFDRAARGRMAPRALAVMSATSNLPVVTGVEWLDAHHAAFLGMDGTPHPQLFVVDVDQGAPVSLTQKDEYVAAYDMCGEVVAYATASEPPRADASEALISVRNTSLQRLLDPDLPPIAEANFSDIGLYPLTLHVARHGREIPLAPLRLFRPVWSTALPLSIAPDGNTVITVAPVARVPESWAADEPWEFPEQLRLRPGDALQTDERNDLKPMQFVAVDLTSGRAVPLLDAPAGASLDYFAPLKIFWLSPTRVIVSNTFVPGRAESAYVADVDLATHAVQPIAPLRTPSRSANDSFTIEDVTWDAAKQELTLRRAARPGAPSPPSAVYALRGGSWVTLPPRTAFTRDADVFVDEAFDRPPRLVARGGAVLLDPNPQLASIDLGTVRLERWTDVRGEWKALLALPPGFDPGRRYPLVIQTHGMQLDRFFTDGVFTTGNPGRALAARGVVVLQMPNLPAKYLTMEDGAWNLATFASAVEHLDRAGIIDPKRVGIIGFSFTCWHTMFALTKHPSLFAAAAITDGNQMSYSQYIDDDTDGFYQKTTDATLGGPPWGNLGEWAARSPDFNLDKVTAPLLINALERGALLRQWEPYAGLRRLGKPVDLLWLRGERAPHVLIQPRHRRLSQQAAVDWFDFWLNGREDPDPSKAEQYARWRELRKLKW